MKIIARKVVDGHPIWLQSLTDAHEVIGYAARKGPGRMWSITLPGRSKSQGPHVRISGRLPEKVQMQLVQAALSSAQE